MFVSYQTDEKFNVEMDDPPQCRGRLNAKIWFSPMLVSAQYQLNHFICACIARNIFKLFSVIIFYYFNLLKISEQISKVLLFLKLGCK